MPLKLDGAGDHIADQDSRREGHPLGDWLGVGVKRSEDADCGS